MANEIRGKRRKQNGIRKLTRNIKENAKKGAYIHPMRNSWQ